MGKKLLGFSNFQQWPTFNVAQRAAVLKRSNLLSLGSLRLLILEIHTLKHSLTAWKDVT